MKFVKALFLSIIITLLISSNLHSQTEQFNKVLRNNFKDTFTTPGKTIENNRINKESFENQSNQILKAATFDSTSVVKSRKMILLK